MVRKSISSYMPPSEDISFQLIKGDEKAFKEFFYIFYPGFCLFARRFISSEEVSKDLVQEAFIEYWKNRENFTSIEKAKGFIYTVIRNKCLNHLKHQKIVAKYDKQNVESEAYFRDSVIEEETCRIIHNFINELPLKSRIIMQQSLEGMSNQEIADTLRISINTVKTSKLKSYRFLREKLKKFMFMFGLHVLLLGKEIF